MDTYTSRSYCITFFGSDDEFSNGLSKKESRVRGAIYQRERCPSTGREHVQAYVEFTSPVRLSHLRKLWRNFHAEKRRGTREQAIEYCSKEESRIGETQTYGSMELQRGRRRDLEDIKSKIKEGASDLEIAESFFGDWVRYRKSFQAYRTLLACPRTWKTELIILWGKAGSGKTLQVYSENEKGEVYDLPRPNGGSVWFDGYHHEVLLLDDFYGWIPLHLLLKLADRYPMQVPCKGGMLNFNAKKLYITSNTHPDEWYKWNEFNNNLRQAFDRRIDLIKEFN